MTTLAATACAGRQSEATTPSPEPAWEETGEGPVFPEWLGLTEAQEPQAVALLDRAKRAAGPLVFAGEGVVRAIASSARRCEADDLTFLEVRFEAVTAAGVQSRREVIAVINDLHALLTPEQRKAVTDYLLDRNERNREQRSAADRGSVTEAQQKMGIDLDLTFGQITKLLFRINRLRGAYEDATDPWIAHYRAAVQDFARADFDLSTLPVAKAPIFRIARDLVLEAYTQLITVFDEGQCEAIGTYLHRKLDERDAEEREATEERAKGEETSPADETDI